jgi:parallel beta-helix repeat protein
VSASLVALAFLVIPAFASAATINVPSDQPTIQAAVAAAVAGDTIDISGTQAVSAAIPITIPLTIQGEPGAEIDTMGSDYVFTLAAGAAGTVIQNLTFFKTDTASANAIILIGADNVHVEHNTFKGMFAIGDSETQRGLEVSAVSGLDVGNNTFSHLRQPAYINNAAGTVHDNYTEVTKGWVVVSESNIAFTNNTWGSGSNANVDDIVIIPDSPVGPDMYPDVLAISAANNGAFVLNKSGATPVQSAAYVDASVGNDGNDGSALSPLKTIGAAVSRVASGGAAYAAAGTYSENVTISKPLTLKGANAGVAGTSTRGAESIVADGGAGSHIDLSIDADNVTVDGFTFEGSVSDPAAATIGVWINAAQKGVTVKNNIVTDNSIGMYPNCSSDCLVQGNAFKANNRAGAAGGAGIYTDQGVNGLTVDQNDFTGHTLNSAVIFASAAAGTNKNVTFTNNTIEDNNADNSMVYVVDLAGGTFSGNKIAQPGATAIKFATADSDITVTKNVLTGSAYGVRIINGTDDGLGAIVRDSSNITVNNNDVSGNTAGGVANEGGYAGALDGACNWWGDASGPGSVGPGTGSPVTASVTYAPWLTTGNLDGDCTGGTAPPATYQVHILKYLDEVEATAAAAHDYLFPMTSSWNAANLVPPSGNGSYTLGNSFGGSTHLYGADTSPMSGPYDYSTAETTTASDASSKVAPDLASCVPGGYYLEGYRVSSTSFDDAAAQTLEDQASFSGATSDEYVIVSNKTCPATGSLVVTKDATGGDGMFKFTSNIPGHASFNVTTSGGTGSVEFDDLTPGTYTVTELAASGWTQTDNECSSVLVTAGDPTTCTVSNTKNLKLGEIRGTVYEDWDGDGKDFESKWEIPLKGWTVYLDTNNNNHQDPGEPTATTNAHGQYTFKNVSAGTYHVREVVKSGWIETHPSAAKYDVTLSAGQIAKNKNFGNFKLGSISGMKYEDKNGNGKKDKNENGLSGWTIQLKKGNSVVATVVTDSKGNYSFANLGPGTYALAEVMKAGWKQTDRPQPVRIVSDKDAKNKNFGNKQTGR